MGSGVPPPVGAAARGAAARRAAARGAAARRAAARGAATRGAAARGAAARGAAARGAAAGRAAAGRAAAGGAAAGRAAARVPPPVVPPPVLVPPPVFVPPPVLGLGVMAATTSGGNRFTGMPRIWRAVMPGEAVGVTPVPVPVPPARPPPGSAVPPARGDGVRPGSLVPAEPVRAGRVGGPNPAGGGSGRGGPSAGPARLRGVAAASGQEEYGHCPHEEAFPPRAHPPLYHRDQCGTHASGSLVRDRMAGGRSPETTSARLTFSSTDRRLARTATQTTCRCSADPL